MVNNNVKNSFRSHQANTAYGHNQQKTLTCTKKPRFQCRGLFFVIAFANNQQSSDRILYHQGAALHALTMLQAVAN